MASGTINGTTNNQYCLSKIEWSATSTVATNKSSVTATLYYKRTNEYTTYGNDWSFVISVGGQTKTIKPGYLEIGTSWVKAATATFTVDHNDDGTKSVTISATGGCPGTSVTSTSCSKTVDLDTIARASKVTVGATSVQMGKSVTITTNRKATSFTHTLTYSFGGTTGTIGTGVGASTSWSVPDLASKISGKASGSCTITCVTYSGTTKVGTSTVTLTLTIPDKSAPTVSAASVKMGNSVTITTNRKSSHFTHTLKYTFGGTTATIKTAVGASHAWTVPDLVSKIAGNTSGTCTITCETYTGSTLVGSSTVTLTLTVPDKSTITVSPASVQMGESVTITIDRKSTGYTHTLTYAIGSGSGTIATGVGTSKAWTVPDLAAYTSNNKSATCTITCKTYTGSTLVGSSTVTLTLTVPDATVPTLSETTITMGSKITISTPKQADAYTHDLTYSLRANGSTTVAASGTIATGVSADYPWTVPLSLAAKIPSSTQGTITITCKTRFANSTTEIGSAAVSFTVTVPNNTTTKPSVTMTLSPVSDLPSAFSDIYLAGKSKIKATYTASSEYSSISSYSTTVLSTKGSANPFTSTLLSNAGTVTVTGVVTDKRGYFTKKTETITVLEYSRPRIIPGSGKNKIICERCNSDGTSDPGGVYLKVQIGRLYKKVVSGGTQRNYCSLSYRYKTDAQGDSAYSAPVTLLDRAATADYVSVVLSDIVSSNSTAYTIQLIAEDDVGEKDTVTIAVPTAFVTFHSPIGGRGFTLGGYHDPQKYDVFNCIFDAEFEGNVCGKVLGLGQLPMIPHNADFNDYKDFGAYAVTQEDIALTIANMPEQREGTLRVWSANGKGNVTGSDVDILQEFIPNNNICAYRRHIRCSSNSWVYGSWRAIDGIDTIVAQGSTTVWQWRKYASGVAECWGRVNLIASIANSNGSFYYGTTSAVAFPLTFVEAPICNSSVELQDSGNTLIMIACSEKTTTTQAGRITLVSPRVVGTLSCGVVYHAIGKWK